MQLLKKETINNLGALESSKQSMETTIEAQVELIRLIAVNKHTISEQYLSELFLKMYAFTNFLNYENNVLSELKNSGELKNIKNDSIRNNIMSLESLIENLFEQEQSVKRDFLNVKELINTNGNQRSIYLVLNRLKENLEIDNDNVSNIPLLKIAEFENRNLEYYTKSLGLVINHYEPMELRLKNLIDIINQELELRSK